MAGSDPNSDRVAGQYADYVMPIVTDYDPFAIDRAEGTTLVTAESDTYLDLFSGISVANAGHNHPRVVEAAKDQLDRLIHTCSYVHQNPPVGALAERLAEITPGALQKTFFCNSGTEAVEGAIKLARKHTGNIEVVALERSFHGRTLGSLALTGNHAYKHGMTPTLNDVCHAPAPYRYRAPYGDLDDEAFAETAADELERVITTHTSGEIAAVVVEPVLGEGGIIVPPDGYLERVREIAHDYGGLVVVDEVQTGYGRTGTMFAIEQFDIEPDILTQAKGIADGLPLGAFTAPAHIADSFDPGDHLSTFGGNPVCCAAALANIDALEDGIIENARTQGEWLAARLAELEAGHDLVGEARGLGLMQGLELVNDGSKSPAKTAAKHVQRRLRDEHDIVIGVGGFYKNVLRLQPPLTIGRDELERAVDAIDEALATEAG